MGCLSFLSSPFLVIAKYYQHMHDCMLYSRRYLYGGYPNLRLPLSDPTKVIKFAAKGTICPPVYPRVEGGNRGWTLPPGGGTTTRGRPPDFQY